MDPENELDTEGNLFNTIDDNPDYDDDSDELGYDENSFAPEDFLEAETEEEEEEEEEKSLFDETEEEEEENQDFSESELEAFNKKLGTDFKTVEDLKASFNAKENKSQEDAEAAEYSTLTNKVSLYEKYIGMDNETLIRNQLLSQAVADKKDINDPDTEFEISEKLEGLKDLGQLDSMAETLRSNLQSQKDKTQGSIDVIDNRKVEASNAVARKNVDDLQNAFSNIMDQKQFLGVTVTKEDILEVYEDIRSDKFFQSINNNQEMIAKLALFVKYEKQLSKLTNSPTHSDKTKSAFDFLSGNGQGKQRSITSAKGSASSGSVEENLMNFIK